MCMPPHVAKTHMQEQACVRQLLGLKRAVDLADNPGDEVGGSRHHKRPQMGLLIFLIENSASNLEYPTCIIIL